MIGTEQGSSHPHQQGVLTLKGFLWVVIADFLLAGVLLQKISTRLYLLKKIPEYCNGTVVHSLHDLFTFFQGQDSWWPMLYALRFLHAPAGIYQTVFFDRHVKFQYPLTSLPPLWLLDRMGMGEPRILILLKVMSGLAVMATVAVALLIAFRSAERRDPNIGSRSKWMLAAVTILVSLTFYPVIKAYALGQIQVFINLLFAIAFLCWMQRRERATGALIGLITLIKPQYALILLWAALRKRWGVVQAGMICVAAGLAISVALFGLSNNLEYLRVLSFLSRHGEVYYANQTFNGLFHRLVDHASVVFSIYGFPEYRPAVYIGTIITSLAILAWCFPLRVSDSENDGILDFSLIGIAVTAASPIAWEHHYGILLPILIWHVSRFVMGGKLSRAQSIALVVVYLLVANDWRMTNLLADSPLNFLQSYLLFGVLLFIGLLRSELGRRAAPFAAPKENYDLTAALRS